MYNGSCTLNILPSVQTIIGKRTGENSTGTSDKERIGRELGGEKDDEVQAVGKGVEDHIKWNELELKSFHQN